MLSSLRVKGLHRQGLPRSLVGADKELRAIRVGASVGHGKRPEAGMLQGEVFVGELAAVDGLAAGSVVVREIAWNGLRTSLE